MMPFIILVWGVVFYQLYVYLFSSPTYVTNEIKEVVNIDQIKIDTFSIVANYRDPFLDKKITFSEPKTIATTNSTKITNTKNNKEKTLEKKWPTLTYNGMIKNNNSDKRVGIVTINGKEYLVKEGDVYHEVKFMVINKHEIKVHFQNETQLISK